MKDGGDTYGKTMVFNSFFNFEDIPKDKIGGWLFRGHDKHDVYQEFVVVGNEKITEHYPEGWIDWCRIPLPVGSPLLTK